MIPDMPRKLPLFVHRERTRHGKIIYYFRREMGPRTRLPDYGADGFHEAYRAALAGLPAPERRGAPRAHTLAWLLAQYRVSSSDWAALSKATRRQRDNIFTNLIDAHGNEPYRAITRASILASREKRVTTPSQARNFLDAMRGVFRWAKGAALIEEDPTEGVANPKRPKGKGFAAWTVTDVEKYQARWLVDTKERVWFDVLFYTGLRRGDAVVIGKQHVRDGIATIRTEKSGEIVEVNIPIPPELAETLSAGPTGDLAWICGTHGDPLTKESFGNRFREACNEAGIRGKSAHGVRKIAATIAAEAGLTVAELEALFGWTGGTMASHYTRTANRKSLAIQGAGKIANARLRTLNAVRKQGQKTV